MPILPGIMPIASYEGFKRMIGFCKTRVPQKMAKELEVAWKLKTETGDPDKAAFTKISTEIVTKLCKVSFFSSLFLDVLKLSCHFPGFAGFWIGRSPSFLHPEPRRSYIQGSSEFGMQVGGNKRS